MEDEITEHRAPRQANLSGLLRRGWVVGGYQGRIERGTMGVLVGRWRVSLGVEIEVVMFVGSKEEE